MSNHSRLNDYGGSAGGVITINNLFLDGVSVFGSTYYTLAGNMDITNGSDNNLNTFFSYNTLGIDIESAISGTGTLSISSNTASASTRDTGSIILGSNNTYSGGTVVTQSANLIANNYVVGVTGSTSATGTGAVTVNSNGLVGGGNGASYGGTENYLGSGSLITYAANENGVISGPVEIQSGGYLSPGEANTTTDTYTNGGVGTLTLGSLTLDAGSIVNYEFNSIANDFTAVTDTGGLNLLGGSFNLYQENTTIAFDAVGIYNLFSYTGTLNGSLSNLSVLNEVSGYTYTFINDTADGLIQLDISAVPEPSTWMMLILGGGVLMMVVRRSRVNLAKT